jgi:ubiquinone biosynthesis protein
MIDFDTVFRVENYRQEAALRAREWTRLRALPGLRSLQIASVIGVRVGRAWFKPKISRRHSISVGVVEAFEKLGPTFVKLAQIISAGDGVFPDELVRECKRLRDQAATESWDSVCGTIERELGGSLDRYFASVEREPIAAASIAQVHRGVLLDGTEVVIKVRRRGIHDRVERDVRALTWLAHKMIGRIPVASLANPPVLVELFAECITEELDFRLERENMRHVAATLTVGVSRVPEVFEDLVREGVMVMEFVEGEKLGEIAEGGELILKQLMSIMIEGATIHGVFHGDLHGGNMIVSKSGEIVLIDFGITARLDERERVSFAKLLLSGMTGDWRGQIQGLVGLGALPADVDVDTLGRELKLDVDFDPTKLSPEDLAAELQNLSKALLGSGAKLPKSLMLWAKNIVFVDSAIGEIAPDTDLIGVLSEVAGEFVQRNGAVLGEILGTTGRPDIDVDAIKRGIGVGHDTERITWREMRERREMIINRAGGASLFKNN